MKRSMNKKLIYTLVTFLTIMSTPGVYASKWEPQKYQNALGKDFAAIRAIYLVDSQGKGVSEYIKKQDGADYTGALKTHDLSLHEGTAEEALWLSSTNSSLKGLKVHEPLYALFHAPLDDNDSRKEFLKVLSEDFQHWIKASRVNEKGITNIQNIVKNVLDNISWEDDLAVRRQVSPFIFNLLKNKELEDTLVKNVKGLFVQKKEHISLLPRFLNLRYLSSARDDISLKDFETLEGLSFNGSDIKTIQGLEYLKSLKSLHFSLNKNLYKVSLKGLEALESLMIFRSCLSEIHDVEDLKSLKSLRIIESSGSERFYVKGFEALEKLTLWQLVSKKIVLENLKSLTYLDVAKNRYLNEFSLKNLEALEELDLRDLGPCVKKITLEDAKSLKSLDLSHLKNLESVRFEGDFSSLRSVNMAGSVALKSIEGDACTWNKDIRVDFSKSGIKTRGQIGIHNLDGDNFVGL